MCLDQEREDTAISSYIAVTKHPKTGDWQNARWLDDYYGRHQYAVEFEDGTIVRPDFQAKTPETDDSKIPTNPDFGWPESPIHDPALTPSVDVVQQGTAPTSSTADDELDEILFFQSEPMSSNMLADWQVKNAKAAIITWADKRAEQQVREARLAELAQFKPVAESWVERHHSYLGVNYLNKRIVALTTKEPR